MGKRYVVQYADTALPWQKFYRVYDKKNRKVVAETDTRKDAEKIAKSLNS